MISTRIQTTAAWLAVAFCWLIPASLWGMQALGALGALLIVAGRLWRGAGPLRPLDVAVGLYVVGVFASWLPVLGLPVDPLRQTFIWPVVAYALFRVAPPGAGGRQNWAVGWTLVGALVGVYGLVQHVWGIDWVRPGEAALYPSVADPGRFAIIGLFDRHHSFGISAAISVAVLGVYWAQADGKKALFGILALAPLLLACLLSQTRAAILALGLVGLLALFRLERRRALGLAALGAIAAGLAVVAEPGLVARLLSSIDAAYNASRLEIYSVSSQLLYANPYAGWGAGRFFVQSGLLFDQLAPQVTIRSGTHLHLLQSWLDGGFFLAVVFSLLCASIIGSICRLGRRREALAVGAGLMVAMFAGFGHNLLSDGELSWPIWALAGWLAAWDADSLKKL